MKLDKSIVQRRLDLMQAEGIVSTCFNLLQRVEFDCDISFSRHLFQMHMSALMLMPLNFEPRTTLLSSAQERHGPATSRYLIVRWPVSISPWSSCRFVFHFPVISQLFDGSWVFNSS
jgi:hypothetical protein